MLRKNSDEVLEKESAQWEKEVHSKNLDKTKQVIGYEHEKQKIDSGNNSKMLSKFQGGKPSAKFRTGPTGEKVEVQTEEDEDNDYLEKKSAASSQDGNRSQSEEEISQNLEESKLEEEETPNTHKSSTLDSSNR